MQSSSCAICISLLERSDDIFSTSCGHVFHMPCLTQWLERSKNCPQCREKLTERKIFRLFFNFNNNESIKEDSASLQMRVDNMQFQLDLREASIKQTEQKYADMLKQRNALRLEVKRCEADFAKKDSALFALKEQIKYLKTAASEKDLVEAKYQSLKSQIDEYQAIRKLLSSTTHSAEEIVCQTQDPHQLGVYVCALKRQLEAEVKRRKELREMIKTMQDDTKTLVQEKRELEAAKTEMEIEVDAKDRLIKELRAKLSNTSNTTNTGANKEDAMGEEKSREPSAAKRKKMNFLSSDKVFKAGSDDEENDPLVHMHRFKMTSAKDDYSKSRSKELPSGSILKKRHRLAATATKQVPKLDERIVPDGLGGYMKIEDFPVSRPKTKAIPPMNISLKRKIDETKNRKMDSFIDLT